MTISFGVVSCAPLSEEERFTREYNLQISEENWSLCQFGYKNAHQPTYSDHSHGRNLRHTSGQIKSDLLNNKCQMLLRDHWIEGI